MQKFIILSDLRIIPILSSYILFNRDLKTSKIIISEETIRAIDYGFIFPYFYNWFKIFILRLFCKVQLIKTEVKSENNEHSDIGVFSSLVSITNDSLANYEKYPKLFNKLKQMNLGSHSIIGYLSKIDDIDEIYVFNGRTAGTEPIVRYFWGRDCNIKFYEYSLIFGAKFTLYDFPVHNCYKYGNELFKFYTQKLLENYSFSNKDSYKNKKLNNIFTKNYFDVSQESFDICIFLASDHELIFLNKDICENIELSNLDLIKLSIDKYGRSKKYAVRAHPNQAKDPSVHTVLKPIIEFCELNNLYFYGPESKISSYSLIENSELIIVGYSSIAEDAIFMNKSVDILGSSDLKAIIDCLSFENCTSNFNDKIAEVLSLKEFFLHYEMNGFQKIIFNIFYRVDIIINRIYQNYFMKYE
uniref:hypothetical protein n=1 Tax=Algoriphagus sp. TaxID=1872435 RepID=UPI0040479DA8